MPPTATATWSPSSACCASPGSVPSRSPGVTASDQEIAAYYNANKATYAPKDTRNLSQAVVPDQATANAIAPRAKGGATLAAAAAPAGANAAVTSLDRPEPPGLCRRCRRQGRRRGLRRPSGRGRRSGPVRLRLGRGQGRFGEDAKAARRSPRRGAKSPPSSPPTSARQAIEDIVDKVQNAVDDGSNFAEAAAAAKLPVTTTPLITANGTARADPAFKLPPELAPALQDRVRDRAQRSARDRHSAERPGLCDRVARRRSCRPRPLRWRRSATQVADRLDQRPGGAERAAPSPTHIAAKAARGMPLAEAVKDAGMRPPAGAAGRRPAHPDRDCARAGAAAAATAVQPRRRARAESSPIPQGAASSWSRSTRSCRAMRCSSRA